MTQAIGPGKPGSLIAGALFVACVGHFLYSTLLVLREPFLLTYGEGLALLAATRILDGLPLYVNINEPPYLYNAYPVMHPIASSMFVLLFGRTISALRLLSIVCEVLIGVITYKILLLESRDKGAALLFAGLLLGLFSIHKYHGLARIDLLALLFTVSAIYCLLYFLRCGSHGRLVLAGAFFGLSLLTKPTAAAVLCGCSAYALLRLRAVGKPSATIIRCTVVSVVGYFLLAGIIDLWSGNEFLKQTYWYQALSGVRSGIWQQVRFLQLYWPIACLATISFFDMKQDGLLKFVTLSSVAWWVISSMKIGADVNYFLEPLVLMTVVSGLFMIRRSAEPSAAWHVQPTSVYLGVGFLITLSVVVRGPFLMPAFHEQARAERAMLNELMHETDGLTLSEEPFYAVLNRKRFIMNDSFQLSLLSRRGVFNMDPIIRACESGEVKRVFASRRLQSIPALQSILRSRYRVIYRTQGWLGEAGWTVYELREEAPVR
jgi:hypothetical protein